MELTLRNKHSKDYDIADYVCETPKRTVSFLEQSVCEENLLPKGYYI